MDCRRCGTCCVAPDIAALDKPLSVPCPHLGPDYLCLVYPDRPEICRRHRPDEICEAVQAPSMPERVERYLTLFGLAEEAAAVRASGLLSMAQARRRGR